MFILVPGNIYLVSAETSHLKVEAHDLPGIWSQCCVEHLGKETVDGESLRLFTRWGVWAEQQPGGGREAMEIGGCRKGDFSKLSMRKW